MVLNMICLHIMRDTVLNLVALCAVSPFHYLHNANVFMEKYIFEKHQQRSGNKSGNRHHGK